MDEKGKNGSSPEFQSDHTRAAAGQPARDEQPRRPSLADQIDEMFTYHAPSGTQPTRYGLIREAAKQFARLVVDVTPAGADQTAAIRKLRECVMTANAAIALEGKL